MIYFLFETAHGRKRSDIPPRAIRPPPIKLNDRFALIKILPEKVINAHYFDIFARQQAIAFK